MQTLWLIIHLHIGLENGLSSFSILKYISPTKISSGCDIFAGYCYSYTSIMRIFFINMLILWNNFLKFPAVFF